MGQACDDTDTDTNSGDGYNPACRVEAGYVCSGQPSGCFVP